MRTLSDLKRYLAGSWSVGDELECRNRCQTGLNNSDAEVEIKGRRGQSYFVRWCHWGKNSRLMLMLADYPGQEVVLRDVLADDCYLRDLNEWPIGRCECWGKRAPRELLKAANILRSTGAALNRRSKPRGRTKRCVGVKSSANQSTGVLPKMFADEIRL